MLRGIKVFNKALTDTQVSSLYISGTCDVAPIHNWKMDEATGSTATDSVAGANAAITGATWSTKGPMKLRTAV